MRDVWRDPSLRLAGGLILLFGVFAASLGVHQSLIAVEVFGLTDGAYALILGAALAASVAASVAVGVVTDRAAVRRRVALLTTTVTALGAALVWLWPAPATFAVAHAALLPVSGSIFGQVFAVARLAAEPLGAVRRQGAMGVLRALFALPFVVVLPLWGLALDAGTTLLAIYPAITLAAALMIALTLAAWPRDEATPWREAPSGLGLRASLAEIASAPVIARVALMGAVQVPPAVNGILLGLTFAASGREVGDVGLYFGAFVAVEVAATLALGPLVWRLPRLRAVALGAVLYASALILLPVLAAGPWVWALILPTGVGGAMIFTLAIAYLQDLLAARPGAGGSLLALQRVSSDGLTTGAYALGAWAQGYAAVAVLGAAISLVAMATLLRLDGGRSGVEEPRARPGE